MSDWNIKDLEEWDEKIIELGKKNNLDWFPKVELEQGIQEVIDWAKTNDIHKKSTGLEYIHKR